MHLTERIVTVHVHFAVLVLHIHNQGVDDIHIDQETIVVELAVVGDKVKQTADDASGEGHVAVFLYRNQFVHRIHIHNLRVAEHKELTPRDFQIIGQQIHGGVMVLGLQTNIIVVFLFNLIIKIL